MESQKNPIKLTVKSQKQSVLDKHRTINLGDIQKEFRNAQEKEHGPNANQLCLSNELAWLKAKQDEIDKAETEFSFEEGQWGKSKLIYVPGDNGKKVIQGGSVGDLVSYLIENEDFEFIEGFLCVHTYFVPSKFLLVKLRELFHSNSQEGSLSKAQENVLNVVRIWITHHWYYFANDSENEAKLNEFIASLMENVNIKEELGAIKLNKTEELKDIIAKTKLYASLNESYSPYDKPKLLAMVSSVLKKSPIVKTTKKRMTTSTCLIASEAVNYLEKNISVTREFSINLMRDMAEIGYLKHATGDLKSFVDGNHLYKLKELKKSKAEKGDCTNHSTVKAFMDIPPIEVACQLTLYESTLFRKISPLELMHQSWNKKDGKTSPNLLKLIKRFNEVSYWVASEIVSVKALKNRVEVLKRFILLADHTRQLNNFSTMMEIIVGLNLAAVQRLEKTWLSVPPKYMQMFNSMMSLTSSSQNYKAYREHVASIQGPSIPYIGIYLRDLTFVEDGNETFLNSTKIVNYEKMRMLSTILNEIKELQTQQYNIQQDKSILQYLLVDRVIYLTDDELRQESLLCEISKRHSMSVDTKTLSEELGQTPATACKSVSAL
eukprot:TRINITY_DN1144_c0_g1_i1.p1 TRINITY_DN1144_c0_g1~~TRINITY_DN1144_c0_g1_i1.p1  ORF type:complete len:605 (-),score=138.63 TRINITY_DN1144_c0_g1_i1:105-1919(-)